MEDHLVVDPGADDISRAGLYSFTIGISASTDGINWHDITEDVDKIGPIWYGEIAKNVYGWSFQISGKNHNPAYLSPGHYVRLSKNTTTLTQTWPVASWMMGKILPSPIRHAWMQDTWTIQVVDEITYLARKKAPVFSVGTHNVAIGADVVTDSVADASVVIQEDEFYGFPSLDGDNAVDGDMNSLWISTKSPDPQRTFSYFPDESTTGQKNIVLNEFFYQGFSPTGPEGQWFEIVIGFTLDEDGNPVGNEARPMRLLTRSGGIQVEEVTFGRPIGLPGVYDDPVFGGEPNQLLAHWAILTYDAERYSRTWGSVPDVPIFEYRNSRYAFPGSVEPDAFGFNLDGQGDFLAIAPIYHDSMGDLGGDITKGPWNVYAVVDGPKMQRYDIGTFNANVTGATFSIKVTQEWALNELAGCFIRDTDNYHTNALYNCTRRIKSNTATVTAGGGLWNTTIEVDDSWNNTSGDGDDDRPRIGNHLTIRPWPEYPRGGVFPDPFWQWTGHGWLLDPREMNPANFNLLADVPAGGTYRKSRDGWHETYDGGAGGSPRSWTWVDQDETWVLDMTPQPGPSSGYGAEGLVPPASWEIDKQFPWIQVSPPRFTILTTAEIEDGTTIINVGSTDGLLQSYPDLVIPEPIKSILVAGTATAVTYSQKTATTLVLEAPWNQGYVPINTQIFQFEDSSATDVWPISFINLRRRLVPEQGPGRENRLIDKVHVFLSYQDNPASPEDVNWRESWDSASDPVNPSGNPIFVSNGSTGDPLIAFQVLASTGGFAFVRNYTRAKHVLVSIRAMTDLSRGRVNEIELVPPMDTMNGLQNATVGEFFSYVLNTMGVPLTSIQVDGASTAQTGSFSTDTSSYIEVLSDLAQRTGQIVWSGPNLQARVINHPNWPSAPTMESWLTVDNASAQSLEVMPYTGYPIAQLQVAVRDADGNTATGTYPVPPSGDGEVIIDPVIRTADTLLAGSIARMLYNELSRAKLRAVITGPAPWARPGAYRIDVNYQFQNGLTASGPYYISAIDHQLSLGGVGAPRHWVSTLELTRIIGAS